MAQLELRLLSSLEKVFLDGDPKETSLPLSGFQNEIVSFQLAYTLCNPCTIGDCMEPRPIYVQAEVISPISEAVHIRQVKQIPVRLAAYPGTDDNYLSKKPGLYPDLLSDLKINSPRAYFGQWDCLWVDVRLTSAIPAGEYPVTIRLTTPEGDVFERTQLVTVLCGELPKQDLIHTKWFYCDCLANYYKVEVFSEQHWQIVENFIRKAVEGGINMILMPIHTPPLDTREGMERLTNQLVDVTVTNGVYSFETSKMKRWIHMCKDCGVQYYEIAHLYTQWGALHAPKIMATVDGEYKKIFGWDTEATGEEYRAFLNAYIPAVREVLKEEGIDEISYWHISDEPGTAHLPAYSAAKDQVKELLSGCRIMDALSNFEFYQKGVVEHPVVANNHIEPFLEAKVPELWTYYCCAQGTDVSNMFIAMPSARNRILAWQLFKYNISGFLQWGYNFYNAQYSDYPLNPYLSTDTHGAFPAGDPFQVYPREDGMPEESIRMAVTRCAMQDLRAFNLLAKLTSREHVVELMEHGLEAPVTFSEYPKNADVLLSLREKVNAEISALLA